MRRIVVALVVAAFFALPASAQHIIGTAFNGSSFVQLVEVNRTTGLAAFIPSTATDAVSLAPGTAYDAAGNRFFFLGTPSGGSLSIYKVDIGAGTFTKAILTGTGSANIQDIEWNSTGPGNLYGVVVVSGTVQLATIDFVGGGVTLLGSTFTGVTSYSGNATLDPSASRLFFMGSPNLYGVDTTIPDVYRSAALSLIVGLKAAGGSLYALQLSGSDGHALRLNTTNTVSFGSAVTTGAALTGGTLGMSGEQTLDSAGSRYYFLGTFNGGALSLFAVDLTSGTLALAGGYPVALTGVTTVSNFEFDGGTLPVSLQRFHAD